MKKKKHRVWKVPLFCYLAALIIFLSMSAVQVFLDTERRQNGEIAEIELPYFMFITDSVILLDNAQGGTDLVTANTDAWMEYEQAEPFHVGLFTFSAEEQNRPGGEMQLYYTTEPGEAFGDEKRLAAQQAEDGTWVFDLEGRKVERLRLDLDTRGGVLYRNWSIVLNAEQAAFAYFVPTATECFLLLFLPLVVSCAFLELRRTKKFFFLRHKGKEKKRST